MLENCSILDWLSTLPPTPQGQPDLDRRRSRKRKRISNFLPPYHLPSPPFDQDTMNPREVGTAPDTPLRKSASRLSPNGNAAEVDVETPRGPRVDPLQVARQTAQSDASSIASSLSEQTSMSEQALSEQTSSTSKKRKRQSSPRKQSNLITIQNAMNHRSFEGEISPPPALGHLLDTIEILARGIGIVSPAKEASVRAEAEASTSRQFRWVRDETFASDPVIPTSTSPFPLNRDELGQTPSIQTVRRVWSSAFEGDRDNHEEGQWNRVVYGKLPDIALEDDSFECIGVQSWCARTTARILPQYMRSGKPAHHNEKVDFCVYVKEQSEELDAVIIASETESINHTDHSGLVRSPIGLSIETKITGHDWVNAVNQITVWLIAQWDSLDDFASGGQSVRPGFSPAAAAGLSFLPGIFDIFPNISSEYFEKTALEHLYDVDEIIEDILKATSYPKEARPKSLKRKHESSEKEDEVSKVRRLCDFANRPEEATQVYISTSLLSKLVSIGPSVKKTIAHNPQQAQPAKQPRLVGSHVTESQQEPVALVMDMVHKTLTAHKPSGGITAVDDAKLAEILRHVLDSQRAQ
ncbi:hypothetical protein CI238_10890 [Colletotrichum incanum]|uniref:PD-(D/E)XK nuclease-like domain-containing protein n=1 Tax=Colletotrichum incanum TaxID=1573173 RepID=A0A162NBF3_COLIC|nr:hypothetical protein CI238_10890 [Colletotrichum incanum]